MSKKIEFFTEGEQTNPGNSTRRIDPASAPQQNFEATPKPMDAAPAPVEGGNVTRRVAPPAAADAPKPMDAPGDVPKPMDSDAAVPPRGSNTRVLGRMASGEKEAEPAPVAEVLPTVGWLVVMEGPGRGASMTLEPGMSQIGRTGANRIQLDFGDTSISRENHAFVVYDAESRTFFVGHGGKANLVRLNDTPVLSNMELSHGDFIRIGETTLRFVAFCGAHFDWTDLNEGAADEAPAAAAAVEAADDWADVSGDTEAAMDPEAPEPMPDPVIEDMSAPQEDAIEEPAAEPEQVDVSLFETAQNDAVADDPFDDPFAPAPPEPSADQPKD